jgi:hypothetical protein
MSGQTGSDRLNGSGIIFGCQRFFIRLRQYGSSAGNIPFNIRIMPDIFI